MEALYPAALQIMQMSLDVGQVRAEALKAVNSLLQDLGSFQKAVFP